VPVSSRSTAQSKADSLRAAWRKPDVLIATWFGAGLLPAAPGTWGSLAALPVGYLLVVAGGPILLGIATALVFVVGVAASNRVERRFGLKDPSQIVVDEVAGMWLCLLPVANDLLLYPVAFIAFRIFDIAKVWPVNILDRKLRGGLGVMADDIAAAIYGGAVTALFSLAFGREVCFLTIC
jgi:phosphatidylglycerophosphatase A